MTLTPLLPGDPRVLGEHRLLGRLGQGGMGTVFLGVGADERAVAVKVLREGPSDAEGRRRFRRELAALQRVRGDHLVHVLGGDVDADTPWIVTRFVPGRRLDEEVAEHGPLSEPALRRVARGIAEGLAALHTADVVHRDLSPGNVLLVDGEPYVIDLGLAVVADVTAHTRSGLVLGTAGYLAPEQVLGDTCTQAVDVHAWGATVAFAGTGRPPYGTGRPEAVLYRVVHDAPDLAGLPPAVADLVCAALAKQPWKRPVPTELISALQDDRELVGVGSGPYPRPHPTGGLTTAVSPPVPLDPVTDVLHLAPDQGTAVLPQPGTAVLPQPGTAVLPQPGTAVLPQPGTAVLPQPGTAVLPAPPPQWDRPRFPAYGGYGPDPCGQPQQPGAQVWPPHDAPERGPAQQGPPPWLPHDAPPPHGSVPVAPDERRPGRVQGAVVAVPALLVLFAAACLAPVAVVLAVLVALVLTSAVAGAGSALRERQDRRGPRRRDQAMTAVGLPWHVLKAVAGSALGLPLVLLGALGAVLAVLAVRTVVAPGATDLPTIASIASGVVAGTLVALSRGRAAASRRLLLRASGRVAPGPARAAAAATVLVLLAALLLLVAGSVDTTLWPLPPEALEQLEQGLRGRVPLL